MAPREIKLPELKGLRHLSLASLTQRSHCQTAKEAQLFHPMCYGTLGPLGAPCGRHSFCPFLGALGGSAKLPKLPARGQIQLATFDVQWEPSQGSPP